MCDKKVWGLPFLQQMQLTWSRKKIHTYVLLLITGPHTTTPLWFPVGQLTFEELFPPSVTAPKVTLSPLCTFVVTKLHLSVLDYNLNGCCWGGKKGLQSNHWKGAVYKKSFEQFVNDSTQRNSTCFFYLNKALKYTYSIYKDAF